MDKMIRYVLLSRSRREVLKYLYFSQTEITGRELAKHIGFSHQQAHNALHQLALAGMIERKVVGPAHLFRLNHQDNATMGAVRKLFSGKAPRGKGAVQKEDRVERHSICWAKAMEFFEVMRYAGEKGNWNAAGLAGIYCCLAAACAILAKHTGMCPATASQQFIPSLLEEELRVPGLSEQVVNLKAILAHKELLEYAGSTCPETEARAFEANVGRYVDWTRGVYNSISRR